VHEGGIATPLIVHWPEGIKDKNKLRHDPCHFVDVLPTLVDLAGGRPETPSGPKLAGRSLAPAFAKDGAVKRDFLYFNHNNNRAIRVGDMKLIATGREGKWELYDLAKDRAEQHDLAGVKPELTARMASQWKAADEDYARTRESAPPSTRKLMGPRRRPGE
jgi:arylsulfatase